MADSDIGFDDTHSFRVPCVSLFEAVLGERKLTTSYTYAIHAIRQFQ